MPSLPVPALHRAVPQYLARRFWQIAATLQSQAIAPFGLANWHVALLAQLYAAPGRDRSWLAAAIGMDATSTGQALAALEARGLVLSAANPADARAKAFSLTPEGEALRAELAAPVRAVARELLSPLSEAEGQTLLDLLVRLVNAHEEHARPGAGRKPPRRAPQPGDTECALPLSPAVPSSGPGLPGSPAPRPRSSRARGRTAPSG